MIVSICSSQNSKYFIAPCELGRCSLCSKCNFDSCYNVCVLCGIVQPISRGGGICSLDVIVTDDCHLLERHCN